MCVCCCGLVFGGVGVVGLGVLEAEAAGGCALEETAGWGDCLRVGVAGELILCLVFFWRFCCWCWVGGVGMMAMMVTCTLNEVQT